ncbi:ABC transporter substrate-binding protein [Promicromonospora sp. NPDC060204]|uniref:ABC transporter substrate-binding protein n=1 Tax=Promicromonospora sp. NPDC060204 TaxID=3347071 RepID=UPI0036535073
MNLPRTPALALAALAPLALAGCGAAAGSADAASDGGLREVTVVLDWTPNTNHSGLYLAQSEGWFEEEGLDVEIVEPGETSGLQLVAAGQADFAYSVAEGLVPARAAGADVVSVATVIEHNTSSLISLADDGIARPRDLEGKRYGSYESDLEKALISKLVECDGGDPAEVEFTPLVSDDFRIGLTEDQFDTAWVFDAWDTIRLGEVDGLDVDTIAFRDHLDCIPDWYTPLVATSRSLLDEEPDVARGFLAALARGYDEAAADPDRAAQVLLEAAPELDPELVGASARWLGPLYASGEWGVQRAEVWDGFVGFLEEEGLTEPGFDTNAAWTDDYLPGAGGSDDAGDADAGDTDAAGRP